MVRGDPDHPICVLLILTLKKISIQTIQRFSDFPWWGGAPTQKVGMPNYKIYLKEIGPGRGDDALPFPSFFQWILITWISSAQFVFKIESSWLLVKCKVIDLSLLSVEISGINHMRCTRPHRTNSPRRLRLLEATLHAESTQYGNHC